KEKAELLAKKITEVKIIEKLSEIYLQEKICFPQELNEKLNFINTFSLVTGIRVKAPSDPAESEKIIEEANNCIPKINKQTEKKEEKIYLVSYTAVFPENCSLPEKEIKTVIEADTKKLTAKVIEGKLDENTRNVLGNNLHLLDSLGNCQKEVVYQILIESGILGN
ncbi:hypothetical protein KKB11_05100, partial [Candidatus Micrarchaeota archaeon]|nr:hypothetical protein [Candidatus Micrarchaeota archaeon]